MTNLKFRIYYGLNDWQDFDCDTDEVPSDRRWGVQGVVFDDPAGRQDPYDIGRYCLCQYDYYLFAESVGAWVGLRAESDLIDWIMNKLADVRCVLKGRVMSKKDWNMLYQQMSEAEGFAVKSGSDHAIEYRAE